MKPIICLLSIAFALLCKTGEARPVSYPGGWTVMQFNESAEHNLHVHYTPSKNFSVGYKGIYDRGENWQMHGAQLNLLIKRWNRRGSQANFYLKNIVGFAYNHNDEQTSKSSLAMMNGMAFDWETRRYFTSYENHFSFIGDIEQSIHQKARIGIAPYLGSYGDWHTWLMLQLDHHFDGENDLYVTPLVRFFKGVFLIEGGLSHRGEILANLIIRF